MIELMSSLSDIVHIERLGQSDWLLYDARGPPQSERPAAKRPTNQEAQIGTIFISINFAYYKIKVQVNRPLSCPCYVVRIIYPTQISVLM